MTAEVPPPPKRPPFERLGDYEVVAPIAEGGMARVWLGRRADRPTELVALKVIRPEHARNKDFLAMLIDEAGIASRLSHPNILAVRAIGGTVPTAPDLEHGSRGGNKPFLVMDLLRGHTLLETWTTLHAQGKRFPPEVVAWLGARIADALSYAHALTDEHGAPLHVVHRDVNAANVFLTSEGTPKLIDFGLAKARDRITSTAIGVVKGKLAYLAPEQALGEPVDNRSDVFALGITLWELSLDRRLFLDAGDVQTLLKVREAVVPDPTTLEDTYPPELARIVLKALAKAPAERWQSAKELRDALDAYVSGTGQAVGEGNIRAILTETFAGAKTAPWERLVDDVLSDQEKTRIWEERKEPIAGESAAEEPAEPGSGDDAPAPEEPVWKAPGAPEPVHTAVRTERIAIARPAGPAADAAARSGSAFMDPDSRRVLAMAAGLAGVAALAGGLLARGCRGADASPEVNHRLGRIEDLLGLTEAGTPATAPPALDAGAVVSLDDRSGSCAIARIASYRLWQEALVKAKANAQPAEAACAQVWNDTRKQGCFHAATAEIRSTQAARDSAIAGGGAARDAAAAVHDDTKNDTIARAKAASTAAFAACDDDGGP